MMQLEHGWNLELEHVWNVELVDAAGTWLERGAGRYSWKVELEDNSWKLEQALKLKSNSLYVDLDIGLTCCHCQIDTSGTADCDTGWFGPKCQFKCQCVGGCNTDGTCKIQRCIDPWVGYKCQYRYCK
ncbi:hypothetical protein Btru_066872 [Bulinus truncatus]|nr:hypothetical protein Btru_066872 [Bulinus truncatus]